jgi:hypothetical protein
MGRLVSTIVLASSILVASGCSSTGEPFSLTEYAARKLVERPSGWTVSVPNQLGSVVACSIEGDDDLGVRLTVRDDAGLLWSYEPAANGDTLVARRVTAATPFAGIATIAVLTTQVSTEASALNSIAVGTPVRRFDEHGTATGLDGPLTSAEARSSPIVVLDPTTGGWHARVYLPGPEGRTVARTTTYEDDRKAYRFVPHPPARHDAVSVDGSTPGYDVLGVLAFGALLPVTVSTDVVVLVVVTAPYWAPYALIFLGEIAAAGCHR